MLGAERCVDRLAARLLVGVARCRLDAVAELRRAADSFSLEFEVLDGRDVAFAGLTLVLHHRGPHGGIEVPGFG